MNTAPYSYECWMCKDRFTDPNELEPIDHLCAECAESLAKKLLDGGMAVVDSAGEYHINGKTEGEK